MWYEGNIFHGNDLVENVLLENKSVSYLFLVFEAKNIIPKALTCNPTKHYTCGYYTGGIR